MKDKIVEVNGTTVTTYEFPYMRKPPEKKSLCQRIYDSKKGKVLGRTPSSWAKICLFYFCFYVVLAALFTICMQTLFLSLSDGYPKWQLDESLIGTNPGLGFRPISEKTEQGSLIWYKGSDKGSINYWVKLIDEFLQPYQDQSKLPGGGKNQVICSFDTPPPPGKVCAVEVKNFGECSSEKGYSYNRSSPCIFLKLNRIFNWVPDFYDDVNTLPEEMPLHLKEHILSLEPHKRKQIWISCQGENPADREALGEIEYYPAQGFRSYYYPFTNTPGYLSPIVAVRFARPSLNRLINIECRAWAKNIIYQGGRDRKGSVHFELMID